MGLNDRFADVELEDLNVDADKLNKAGYAYLTAKIADISTAGSIFLVSPIAGTIENIYSAIKNAISSVDAALTFELGGTAITGSAITIGYDGSAAGDVDSSSPTALKTVAAGEAIEIITDGGSTDVCECLLTLVIKPS